MVIGGLQKPDDLLRHRPPLFQAVELSRLWREQMDDKVAEVQEDPS